MKKPLKNLNRDLQKLDRVSIKLYDRHSTNKSVTKDDELFLDYVEAIASVTHDIYECLKSLQKDNL